MRWMIIGGNWALIFGCSLTTRQNIKLRTKFLDYGFGFRHFSPRHQAELMCTLSTLFRRIAIALEWKEDYPGSVKKPVQVRWAGIACKIVELLLGLANWGASKEPTYN